MIRSIDRSFDKHSVRRRTRLRAHIALFTCMATLAFASFVLLGTNEALAQDQGGASTPDTIAAAAPENIIGKLPLVNLEVDARGETPAPEAKGDSGKQRAGLTYQHVNLMFPQKAATGLVYDGTQKNGYVGRPEAILTVPGESDSSWQYPFYVEYSGINDTDYHPPKCYNNKDHQGINDNAPVNAGDYRVVFSAPEDDAFVDKPKLAFILNPNHIDFTIAKAPALTLSPLSASTIDAAGYQRELDLASMLNLPADLNGGPAYAVVDSTTNGLAVASIDSATGKLTLASKGGAGLAASDTVTVALTNMGNYEDSTVEVNVSYAAKPTATISGVQAATDLVYNGKPQQGYTGSPEATYLSPLSNQSETYTGPFVITYTGTASDGSSFGPTAQPPTASGVYRVEFSAPESALFTGSRALDFSIGKGAAKGLAAAGDGPLPGLVVAAAGAAILTALTARARLITQRRNR